MSNGERSDDDLSSEAWSNSRDTGEKAFPELDGEGPNVYTYNVRGARIVERARYDRSGDQRPIVQCTALEFSVVAGRVVFAPTVDARGAPHQLASMPERYGRRVVVGVALTGVDTVHAHWRCECGATGRMTASRWRTEALYAKDRGRAHYGCKRCTKAERDRFRGFTLSPIKDPIVPFFEPRRRA